MRMIVLVAGVGSRLRPLTDDRPKCLVEVGGRSILERILVQASATERFEEVILITGYRADAISAFVEKWQEAHNILPIRVVHNERYDETNNGYSLWCAREWLGDGFVLIDGDVVLDSKVWERIVDGESSVLAVDMQMRVDEEAMKFVRNDAGHVIALSKELALSESEGESIGLCRISVADAGSVVEYLDLLLKQGLENEYYERAFQEKIASGWELGVVDIGDLAWVEIDDHSDLERAEKRFG